MTFDVLFRAASVIDGSGTPAIVADVAVYNGVIVAIGDLRGFIGRVTIDASALVLAPGFIDVHTHDDLQVIRHPEMLPKISQGITTVVVGNCGISATPVTLKNGLPDPMNLLGRPDDFCYATFSEYVDAITEAGPAVNVAALVGHTALRNNHMDRLDRAATPAEIDAMNAQLEASLQAGALGLSTGLAYASAINADRDEIVALAKTLSAYGAVYTTHLRTEFDGILDALEEAFDVGRESQSPVIISHLKCAGAANWGRSGEVIAALEQAAAHHPVGCDCYPYSASSSTLDLKQVTSDFEILITWSDPHPEHAGRTLAAIANEWGVSLMDAAKRLQPAGAVYHGMSEADVQTILKHPLTMIGSDGLPVDPLPHPRLWGAFPRVLGHYSRDQQLFPLEEAIRKMTRLSADRFGLRTRGRIAIGAAADLVLFDPKQIRDTATFEHPVQCAEGICAVWVNGVLSYEHGALTGARAGEFLARDGNLRDGF